MEREDHGYLSPTKAQGSIYMGEIEKFITVALVESTPSGDVKDPVYHRYVYVPIFPSA